MEEIQDIKPIVVNWLTQWKNAASKTGSRMEYVYNNALKSLRAHDQPVTNIHDCRKIKYFGNINSLFSLVICIHFLGDKLCERVKDSLRDHYKNLGIPFEEDVELEGTTNSSRSSKSKTISQDGDTTTAETSSKVSKQRKVPSKPRSYVPPT